MPTIRSSLDQAKAALVAGKAEAAIPLCRAVLEKYPKQLEATCLLAEAFREMRQLPEATDLFERVVSADPESLIGHWGLSTIFEEQGKSEAALYELRIAWDLSPGHPAVREELVRLRDGQEPALSRAALARVYWRGHQYRRALAEARAVLETHPERLDVGVLLAELLWRMGRKDEAAELCAELLAESPDCLKASLIRGYAVKDGRKLLARALQVDPECSVALGLFPGAHLPGPLVAGEVELDEEPVTLASPPDVAPVAPTRVSVLVAAELAPSPPAPSPAAGPAAAAPPAGEGEPLREEQAPPRGHPAPGEDAAAEPTLAAEPEPETDEERIAVAEPAAVPEPAALPELAEIAEPVQQTPVPEWLAAQPAEEAVAAAGLDPGLYAEWADLLAEEVDLDPASAARLEAALAEATGSGTGSGPWKEIVLDGVSLTPPAVEPEAPKTREPEFEPPRTPEDELAAVRSQASDLDSLAEAFRDLLRARPDVASVAAIELRGLVEASPDHAGLRRALGDAYMRCGRFQKAIEEYNRAVALQPPAAVA